MKKSYGALLAGVSLLAMDPAYGQSNPGFYFNFVPTAGQWNSYFSGKADYPAIINNSNTWGSTQTFNNVTVSGSLSVNNEVVTGSMSSPNNFNTPIAISALPVCDNNAAGMRAVVNNGITAPTYHQAVSGSASAVQPVFCSGTLSGWIYD